MKKTKIVCTIGPASDSPEMIERLIKAGMDVARLNFSHGTHEGHAEKIRIIRETADRLGRTVAILTDIAGPKIRVGEISRGSVELKKGRNFILTDLPVPGDEKEVSVTYQDLPKLVRRGDAILLNDGALELKVTGRSKNRINCRIIVGGILSSHKGVNLPTPKSPRATMIPSAASMILSIFSTASGFSILAISAIRLFFFFRSARTSSTSSAVRTNERPM